jgi:hypothetical protein
MKTTLAVLLVVVALAAPAFGHHSFAAEYDGTKPVNVTGTVTRVAWTNPHIWIYVEVEDEGGEVTNWAFSAAPPGVLMRRGIMKSVIPVGEVIQVSGFRARDGSNNASGGSITFTDGRSVLTASAEDQVPEEDE